ncbi:hypothetical protein bcgnr5369_68720 [Bacillus cereus]
MREDMYLFQRQGKEYKVIDKEWENVRDQLVNMRTNGGFPYLVLLILGHQKLLVVNIMCLLLTYTNK